MRKFIIKFIMLVMIVSVIVEAVNLLYVSCFVNFGTMGDQKNDMAYIENVPEDIEICNFGNSHGYYGFNYDSYNNDYICFNFSLPSQSMSYNYRILNNYRDNIAKGAVVFICVSYTSFFGEEEIALADFYTKNKRYYHFLERDNIKEYDATTDFFVHYLPVLATDLSHLAKVILKVDSIDYWNKTTTKEEAKEHGLMRYKSQVAAKMNSSGDRIYNEEEILSVYEIINLCNEIEAVPVLITTPYLSEYTRAVMENDPGFYDDFYGVINKIQKDTGVYYYDYQFDKQFKDDYDLFFNTDHLNIDGAGKLTDILMKEVEKLKT